jgi:hypothetical protein
VKRTLHRLLSCLWCLCALAVADTAWATPVALDDDELGEVTGQNGVSIGVHLELNSQLLTGAAIDSRLVAGFQVNGVTTYAVMQNLAGVVDMYFLTLDVRQRPGGGDYIDLGLPSFVGMNQFGFRALAVQSSPTAPITQNANYGQVILNGTATMTGHVYIWAAP